VTHVSLSFAEGKGECWGGVLSIIDIDETQPPPDLPLRCAQGEENILRLRLGITLSDTEIRP
jgi:hypothetical protein